MPQPRSSGEPHATLPAEVICMIVNHARNDFATLKQLRLCCRWLANEVAKCLFEKVNVELCRDSMERLNDMSKNKEVAACVKRLIVIETPRLFNITFDKFVRSIVIKDRELKKDTELMQKLYAMYQCDINESALFECLSGQSPPAPPHDMSGYQQACQEFGTALCKLSNLSHVQASRTVGIWGAFSIRWRGIKIRTETILPDSFPSPAAEATATSFILRTLGLRNTSSQTLTSLRMDLAGDQYWTLQELADIGYSTANEEQTVSHGGYRRNRAQQEMQLVAGAFTHLRKLQLHVRAEDEFHIQTGDMIKDWLTTATELEILDISLSTVDPVDQFTEDDDRLARVIQPVQFAKLKELTLATSASTESLLSLLSKLSKTLEKLELIDCRFFGNDNWPDFYGRMRDISFERLRHLDFTECVDFDRQVPDKDPDENSDGKFLATWSGTAPDPLVIHYSIAPNLPEADRHEGEDRVWKGCSAELYAFLLGKADTRPPLYRYPFPAL